MRIPVTAPLTAGAMSCLLFGGLVAGAVNGASPADRVREATSAVDTAMIIANEETTEHWLSYNLGYTEQRYSRLRQITTDNVGELGLAWSYDIGSERGLEATPIVVDGVMYVSGPWSTVHAIDARTGERLWYFDPEVDPKYGAWACCDVVNRGVAVYRGKVFVGALHGYLIALDAATGEEVWRRDTNIDRERYRHTITGAPRVFNDTVVIGHGGAELTARGYVTAYDTETGVKRWRWYSVPRGPQGPFEDPSMEMAAATWDPDGVWHEVGGGGTIWDSMVYDPELDLLYVGVGNGTPWNRDVRSPAGGDNLFLSSIVALNASTGEYVWHYQQVPGETWDYTATQHIILADLEIGGEERKVLMQAPKNGFFFLIDRTDGSFISAEPFVEVNWAEGYDSEGRPIEVEGARAQDGGREVIPTAYGAHNWHPMSYNPETGLVYIPAQGVPLALESDPDYQPSTHQPGHAMSNLGWNLGHLLNTVPPEAKPFGHLLAWDPVNQREVWRQEYLSPWNGGTVTTAGNLVFQGTADGRFLAYDATTGEPLWQQEVGSGVIAGPVSYAIDGTQYVSVAVGWGGVYGLAQRHTDRASPGRVYTFTLGGDADPPPVRRVEEFRGTELVSGYAYAEDDVNPGAMLYVSNCLMCHGAPALNNGGNIPNLAYSDLSILEQLPTLVLEGAWTDRGMPHFEGRLTEGELRQIAAYVQYMADTMRE
ncbi:MAG: PQQ-dependent dehydrogenase, methanol/ethanol family [Ectothiorhodospiraceae bacterium]|nr:PQQ-dependent dehydrogenase, methanol/ethanol family [Ectothiorhodospiraceae bacterium]